MLGIAAYLLSAPLAFANQRGIKGAWGWNKHKKKDNFCSKLNSIVREKYFKIFFNRWTFPFRPSLVHQTDNTGPTAWIFSVVFSVFLNIEKVSTQHLWATSFSSLEQVHNISKLKLLIHKACWASQRKTIFDPSFSKTFLVLLLVILH